MPVISLHIPVSELLGTIQRFLTNGKGVRVVLLPPAMELSPVYSSVDSQTSIQV